MITKEEILPLIGDFTWCWDRNFFVETPLGNFHWKDPEYGGDNTFTKFDGTLKKFYKSINIPYGRDKGKHIIEKYCGKDIILVQ